MKAAAVGCGSWLAKPGRSLASMKAYSEPVMSGTSRSMPVTLMPNSAEFRVHLRGDIVDRATLMQVGGVANAEPSSSRQDVVQHPSGFRDRRLGDFVERD